jgi:hypothetical protein
MKSFRLLAVLGTFVAADVSGPSTQQLATQATPGARVFDTMEYRVGVVTVVAVRNPYAMAFLPGGDMLIT